MARKRAFTLIELLVTVGIISLLISITLPSISEARRISKKTQCQHNLHEIGVGIQAYLQVHGETFPFLARLPSIESVVAKGAGKKASSREPYIPIAKGLAHEFGAKSKVLECPADQVTQLGAEMEAMIAASGSRLRVGNRYYDSEDTSYEWTTQVNGLHRHTRKLPLFNGIVNCPLRRVWIVNDFEPYHGGATRKGPINYLYADLHVSDKME